MAVKRNIHPDFSVRRSVSRFIYIYTLETEFDIQHNQLLEICASTSRLVAGYFSIWKLSRWLDAETNCQCRRLSCHCSWLSTQKAPSAGVCRRLALFWTVQTIKEEGECASTTKLVAGYFSIWKLSRWLDAETSCQCRRLSCHCSWLSTQKAASAGVCKCRRLALF